MSAIHEFTADELPAASAERVALRVTSAAERAIRKGHPWLFEGAIRERSREGEAGDLAVVFDRKGRFLAVGLLDPCSPIRVRVLRQGTPAPIDRAWFDGVVARAAALRRGVLVEGTDACRLLHGEADGLPGLVADRYGPAIVLKLYSAAWIPHLADVVAALERHAPFEHLIVRLARGLAGRTLPRGLADGSRLRRPGDEGRPPLELPLFARENGLRFEVDPVRGQKTGLFLDQRENRARVERRAREAGSVLNVFAYTGGFSVHAARGGARHVTSLDASRPALEAAERNFAHNREIASVAACAHETLVGDAFEQLEAMGGGDGGRGGPGRRDRRDRRDGTQASRRFGMVILDPPSFAKRQEEVPAALASYERLVRLGLRVLRPGGVLVAASCSSRVEPAAFFGAVARAAEREGRDLRELERTGHPVDHPVVEAFPEGVYLKCLFARVH